MNEHERNGRRDWTKPAGFYAVILALIAAACITAIALQGNARPKTVAEDKAEVAMDAEGSLPGLPETEVETALDNARTERKSAEVGTVKDSREHSAALRGDAVDDRDSLPASGVITAHKYARPVGGTLIRAYSGDELVYSNTFDDWRVHSGTDYKAAPGEAVRAIADGTVRRVYDDELWGRCVSVSHEGGIVSYYFGLGEAAVKEGARVSCGDTLGAAGVSAAAESADEPHVHLEVTKEDKRIDPESLFAPLE